MSKDIPALRQELECSLQASVRALGNCLSTTTAEEYNNARSEIYNTVARALQPISQQLNQRSKVNQLPRELFHTIVSYLSPRDLYASALVCRSWRNMLLDCPALWTRICLIQRTAYSSKSLSTLLDLLLARSRGLPLRVEFQSLVTDDHADKSVYGCFADGLIAHMDRVKELSLVIPLPAEDTIYERLLSTEAPALECFRLTLTNTDRMMRLPSSLFPSATRLRHVSLLGAYFPTNACPSLHLVTHLVYDPSDIEDEDIGRIRDLFPSLHSLTLLGIDCQNNDGTEECQLPLDLRLPNIPRIYSVIACFPNARSICLSSALEMHDSQALEALLTIQDIVSLELAWRPCYMDVARVSHKARHRRLALKLNGAEAAVDLSPAEVATALRTCGPTLGPHLRALAIPDDIICILVEAMLARLESVTIYVSRADEWPAGLLEEAPAKGLEVSSLCLVLQRDARGLSLSLIAELIDKFFDMQKLRKFVLCGAHGGTRSPAYRALRRLLPSFVDIELQPLPVDHFEPWVWNFPKAGAIHI